MRLVPCKGMGAIFSKGTSHTELTLLLAGSNGFAVAPLLCPPVLMSTRNLSRSVLPRECELADDSPSPTPDPPPPDVDELPSPPALALARRL